MQYLEAYMKENDECQLCGNRNIQLLHKGTRDNPNVNVLKCMECGLIFLSTFEHIHNGFYENSKMRVGTINKNTWEMVSAKDNERRVHDLGDTIRDKDVLDFGCGEGGFIYYAGEEAKSICGIELDRMVREMLVKEKGYCIWESFNQCNRNFDIITLFHVIEHLEHPQIILDECRKHLNPGGKIIIETPNADDALLNIYHSDAFADFTYWSPHIFLYNIHNLETLAQKSGFNVVWSGQIQRYPLANHLYWLSEGKPGGQFVYEFLNDKEINEQYEKVLAANNACDTLMICLETT